MLTYSQRKSFARTGAASLNATVAAAVAEVAANSSAQIAANKAEYAKRTAPIAFTPEQLKAAKAIRTSSGWHRVVKVSAKSVSVETGYSWTDRYTLDRILEVR
jgi:hypothetical protein